MNPDEPLNKEDFKEHTVLVSFPPVGADENGFTLYQKKGEQKYAVVAFSKNGRRFWSYQPVRGESSYNLHWFNTTGQVKKRLREDPPGQGTYSSYVSLYNFIMEEYS
jgi:hypothetical protein